MNHYDVIVMGLRPATAGMPRSEAIEIAGLGIRQQYRVVWILSPASQDSPTLLTNSVSAA
jgi:hypothetical protein